MFIHVLNQKQFSAALKPSAFIIVSIGTGFPVAQWQVHGFQGPWDPLGALLPHPKQPHLGFIVRLPPLLKSHLVKENAVAKTERLEMQTIEKSRHLADMTNFPLRQGSIWPTPQRCFQVARKWKGRELPFSWRCNASAHEKVDSTVQMQ